MTSPAPSAVPVVIPDLGTGTEPARVTAWFAEAGDLVDLDEPILELAVPGATCEITACCRGRIDRILKPIDSQVRNGDVAAWIHPAAT